MGLTNRYMQSPLFFRDCPSCHTNLIDAEISTPIKRFCEPGAFHSRLLGGRDPETGKLEYWECPDCGAVFPVGTSPVIHTMSHAYLK